MGTRNSLRFQIIIPPRIELARTSSLERIRRELKQATICQTGSARPLLLEAREADGAIQLVDFPTPIIVLENWIQRRLRQESLGINSKDARKLEQDELGRFERMLQWWAEAELQSPEHRERVRVVRFDPKSRDLQWLASTWGFAEPWDPSPERGCRFMPLAAREISDRFPVFQPIEEIVQRRDCSNGYSIWYIIGTVHFARKL